MSEIEKLSEHEKIGELRCIIGNPNDYSCVKTNLDGTNEPFKYPLKKETCPDDGYKTYHEIAVDCMVYNKNFGLDTLNKFLNFYVSNYDNHFSYEFKQIVDLSKGRIIDLNSYAAQTRRITSKNGHPYIVYALFNKKKNLFRIGFSGDLPLNRLLNYFYKSLTPNPDVKRLGSCHKDIREKLYYKQQISKIFEYSK